jgi:hypothetical protein
MMKHSPVYAAQDFELVCDFFLLGAGQIVPDFLGMRFELFSFALGRGFGGGADMGRSLPPNHERERN